MPTTVRGYLPSATASPGSPPFDPAWDLTTGAVRRRLSKTKALGVGTGTVAVAETSLTPIDILTGQFTSLSSADGGGNTDFFPVGPIAGTFDVVVAMRESGTGQADMCQQVRIHIYDSTMTTKRGTIYSGQNPVGVSPTISDPNAELDFTISATRILVSFPLDEGTDFQAGDRVVFEHGGIAFNVSATSRTINSVYRDDTLAAADHTLTAGDTSNAAPWVDFHLTNAPNVPITLLADPATYSVDLDWTAPSGGDPVDSYEVRIDAGAPVDVGNVLATTITGLSPSTSYTASVRSKNGGGVSAWVTVPFTTDPAPDPSPSPGHTKIHALITLNYHPEARLTRRDIEAVVTAHQTEAQIK